ncbi:probable cardiolipin synthase (CMP-forming) [Biomphalaria glabrata]|uniref:cardiolipin synthase (CMP-forming) n=1 Tax=Biomphalaria glabrata TaxID=6526 RepID=A0A9U8E9Q3_BIOGL|nr:probable cardiolipin synthase (CMP-forming) [Biomphalaria glabrata]
MTKGKKILSLLLNEKDSLFTYLSTKVYQKVNPKLKEVNHSLDLNCRSNIIVPLKSYVNSKKDRFSNSWVLNCLVNGHFLNQSQYDYHSAPSKFKCNHHTHSNATKRNQLDLFSNSWLNRSLAQKPSYSTNHTIVGFLNCDQRHYSTFKHNRNLLIRSLIEKKLFSRNVRKTIRHQDISDPVSMNSNDIKFRVRNRTRTILHSKLSKLKKSILLHKCQLKDKWKDQQLRSLQAVGKLKNELKAKKENIKTVPNLLTTMRMASAPVLAYLVVHDYFGTACTIFVFAGITDLLDGYIARNFKNQRTALGTALDPLADKLLVSFLGIALTSAGLIPVPMTVLILSRDLGLILASFYIRYISLPPPKTLSRYFDVSLVTAKLYPSTISKVNTGLQLSYVAATLASPVFNFVDHPWLQGLMYLTAATTMISGVDYVLTWRRRMKIIQNK